MQFKGVIFDLDGVLTSTAQIHARAWKEMFDEFLKDHYTINNKPFIGFDDKKDYYDYIDGKPRYNGVKDFLESRDIELVYGSSKDKKDKRTICGLGNKKNEIYQRLLKKQKPGVFNKSIEFVKSLRKNKVKIGLVSSSKNCNLIIEKAGIKNLFDVVVDGILSEKKSLMGKPNPDVFIYACNKLKLRPAECVVFEDALSGVESGRKGNFGLVVGVSRSKRKLYGSDLEIRNFSEISIKKINEWFDKGIEKDNWKLRYNYYLMEKEKLRETLCAVGNGYVGTRGCFETESESPGHYPGTYIAGIYNELVTKVNGLKARNNDLVNCPNWLLIKIFIGNQEIRPFDNEIIEYKKILDTKTGILYHRVVFRDKKGRVTKLESERIVSMANPNACLLKFNFTPLNYQGSVRIQSLIDLDVKNNNVARYRGLKNKHIKVIEKKKLKKGILAGFKTASSKYEVYYAQRSNIKNVKRIRKKYVESKNKVGEEFIFNAVKGKLSVLEKVVSISTSVDSRKPREKAIKLIEKIKNYNKMVRDHKKQWTSIWDRADVYIEGDRNSNRIFRTHIYHLFSAFSGNSIGLNVGMPARGLHGEAYHGHIFWDELFILPFYIHKFPDIAKAALIYRYGRLKQAKEYSKQHGYSGAMYPWQSADSGKEETQTIHYNPRNGKWGADYSRNQRHVSSAIFLNFYKYIKHTNDINFLNKYGIEVMIEIARFWASISRQDKKTGKYHIGKVMGPDEFHEHYPNSKKLLEDNAYTNVMAAFVFEKIIEMVKKVKKDVKSKLGVSDDEISKWGDMSNKMNVIVKNGIIMQFSGFDKLKEINWQHYIKKYGKIERLDRILKKEGKKPDEHKAIKQADVLMIFYALGYEEAFRLLRKLGVRIMDEQAFLWKNYEYYALRTTHGSSLSRFVHEAVITYLEKKESVWEHFLRALEIDVYDTQGGTTSEGIHAGLMAGTVNFVRKYLAGVKTHESGISIEPRLPKHWKLLRFKIRHQNSWYGFVYGNGKIEVKLLGGKGGKIFYKGKEYGLSKGKKVVF